IRSGGAPCLNSWLRFLGPIRNPPSHGKERGHISLVAGGLRPAEVQTPALTRPVRRLWLRSPFPSGS
ncbi:MAG: hypothetical protein ABL893_05155, partial [Hyphomicrobium sp.]